MGDVAARASVSKALVHYHFHDKDSLLLALVEQVGTEVVERERTAMSASGRAGGHALDLYWSWLASELARGDLRILMALAEYDSERVRAASRRVARERSETTALHVAQVFQQLDLTPRLPAALLAETLLAFVDGLSASAALEPERDRRPAFDALWLALLTLTE
jgi:AcrR family transcriptional regulator